jgi:hypothetical protein
MSVTQLMSLSTRDPQRPDDLHLLAQQQPTLASATGCRELLSGKENRKRTSDPGGSIAKNANQLAPCEIKFFTIRDVMSSGTHAAGDERLTGPDTNL